MENKNISYESTKAFSSAIIRYINNDDSLLPFIQAFPSIATFGTIIKEKQLNCNRTLLYKVLQKQYNNIDELNDKVKFNIKSLTDKNTFTVTTGHQLNIFTGPLYFIFKIISTINLAKELKLHYPEKHFVPVYWMASEDHDFAEINHTFINNQKILWADEVKGPTGKISIANFKKVLVQISEVLGNSERAIFLKNLFEKAYLNSSNLSDATRILVNELFCNDGLIVLDANDMQLKQEFLTIIEQDILQQNSHKLINTVAQQLSTIGIKPQINVREINFFYMLDDLRERIVYENGKYKILNTDIHFSTEELLLEIRNHPERFSPNVAMRPLYQEKILPNLAYIGGGAEINYWLQLKSTFEHYKINYPILMLRNSALIIPPKIKHKIKKLHLQFEDIFLEDDDLIKRWIHHNVQTDITLAEEMSSIHCIFEKLKLRTHKIDKTLSPSAEAIHKRLQKAMIALEKKILRAEKRNNAEAINDIKIIKKSLFPNDSLQERNQNFSSMYLLFGEELLPTLFNNLHPLQAQFTILY